MPTGCSEERFYNLSPWLKQYREQFVAKGCSVRKADELAYAKVQKKLHEGKIKCRDTKTTGKIYADRNQTI